MSYVIITHIVPYSLLPTILHQYIKPLIFSHNCIKSHIILMYLSCCHITTIHPRPITIILLICKLPSHSLITCDKQKENNRLFIPSTYLIVVVFTTLTYFCQPRIHFVSCMGLLIHQQCFLQQKSLFSLPICMHSLVEISQNVTTPFMTTCDLQSFATRFGNICNYKTKFQLFWSFSQL